MPTYLVEKRIINNYLVTVLDAPTPEAARLKAEQNCDEGGQLYSENEDGVCFEPTKWRVYEQPSTPDEPLGPIDPKNQVSDPTVTVTTKHGVLSCSAHPDSGSRLTDQNDSLLFPFGPPY